MYQFEPPLSQRFGNEVASSCSSCETCLTISWLVQAPVILLNWRLSWHAALVYGEDLEEDILHAGFERLCIIEPKHSEEIVPGRRILHRQETEKKLKMNWKETEKLRKLGVQEACSIWSDLKLLIKQGEFRFVWQVNYVHQALWQNWQHVLGSYMLGNVHSQLMSGPVESLFVPGFVTKSGAQHNTVMFWTEKLEVWIYTTAVVFCGWLRCDGQSTFCHYFRGRKRLKCTKISGRPLNCNKIWSESSAEWQVTDEIIAHQHDRHCASYAPEATFLLIFIEGFIEV